MSIFFFWKFGNEALRDSAMDLQHKGYDTEKNKWQMQWFVYASIGSQQSDREEWIRSTGRGSKEEAGNS